ncbi:MAG: phosphate signaling complex protein PhoU [Nitrospinae bacterium]|nr:phosphate signaling complex protein PhoU [Nitrospinota bacterium]
MPHYNKYFDQELQDLKETVLRLGGMVEEQVSNAIQSLMDSNLDLAKSTIDLDHAINKLEVEIDERCIDLLALRQPMGPDLRFVTTAMKIVDNLERMGDMAANICERVIDIAAEPRLKAYLDIPRMADIAKEMLKDSLDAFVTRSTELAQKVRLKDDMVDALMDQIFRELLSYMIEDPKAISRATRIMFIAKYIERVADHATNISEMVIYMVEGRIVRHTEPEALNLPDKGE